MKNLKSGMIVKHNNQLGKLTRGAEKKLYFVPAKYYVQSWEDLTVITEENVQDTTHDEKVEFLKNDFTWGDVIKTYTVGEYVIFEYIDGYDLEHEKVKNIRFHALINYQTVSISYHSLDSCLIGTIAYKFDGANSQAAGYFEKMIGMKGAN